jgi:hypothetical protein
MNWLRKSAKAVNWKRVGGYSNWKLQSDEHSCANAGESFWAK